MAIFDRRRLVRWLLPCVTSLLTLLASQFAQASMSFAICGTNGSTNFTNVTAGTSYALILYAMVQDSTSGVMDASSYTTVAGTTDPNGYDGVNAAMAGVDLSGTLASAAVFHNLPTTGSKLGVTYQGAVSSDSSSPALWSSGGSVGIGSSSTGTAGSSASAIYASESAFWTPQNVNITGLGANTATWNLDTTNYTYATLTAGGTTYTNYTAIPIAKLIVSFTGTLTNKTANVGLVEGSASGSPTNGVDQWTEAGVTYTQNGNNDITSPISGSLLNGTLGGLLDSITFSGSSTGGNPTVTGAAGVSAVTATPSTILGNGSLQIAGTGAGGISGTAYSGGTSTIGTTFGNYIYTNTTTNTQDSLSSWHVTGTVSDTVGGSLASSNSSSSSTLAAGGTAAVSFVYTSPTNFFGADTITLSPTGLTTTGGTGALSLGSSSTTLNIIGLANRGSSSFAGYVDGSGTVGTYAPGTLLTSSSVAAGASLAGYMTTLGGSASYGIGNGFATILAGSLSSNSSGISMQWRSRSSAELPGKGNYSAGQLPLYSDVVNLSGIPLASGSFGTVSGSSASAFAFEMSYDPSQLGGTAAANYDASNGYLYLGYRDPTSGKWFNAALPNGTVLTYGTVANGNDAAGQFPVSDFQGSYAAFLTSSSGANGHTLAQTLGSWGVDTLSDTVWAVVDHSGEEFAAVPEPGTLALLAAGVASLAIAYRRRKVMTT